jgi:hypothetical protein
MAVTIVKSNQTVPTLSNDAYPGTDTFLFSVLQGTAFSIDVAFTLDDGAIPPVNVPITSVVPSLSGGYGSVSFTTVDTNPSAYKIRVAGTFTNVLLGESYQLLLEDGSLVTVPVSGLPSYRSITAWNLPSVFSQLLTGYSFNINSGVATATMNQYVYWDLNSSITAFKSVVQGSI